MYEDFYSINSIYALTAGGEYVIHATLYPKKIKKEGVIEINSQYFFYIFKALSFYLIVLLWLKNWPYYI